MSDFEWDPETYLALMAEEIPDYPRLQTEVAAAAATGAPRSILDLGVGSGLTAQRVLEALPEAELLGIDASSEMLSAAESTLDPERTRLQLGRLEESLPKGPFDLVMSTLSVHHLDGPGKAEQWDILVRARAVDTTTFVIACDQADPAASGRPATGSTPLGVGHSSVISPLGSTLASGPTGPRLTVVDVQAGDVEEARSKLPVLANARQIDAQGRATAPGSAPVQGR